MSVHIGTWYKYDVLNQPNISKDLCEIVDTNFERVSELLKLTLYPETGILEIQGDSKVCCVDVKTTQHPQFLGNFTIDEILSTQWDTIILNQLRSKFNITDTVSLIYYPDYKIMKFATENDENIVYIQNVDWSKG